MNGRGGDEQKLNGGILHCLAKLTLYMRICSICDGLYMYASWRRFVTVLKRSIENHAHEANPT